MGTIGFCHFRAHFNSFSTYRDASASGVMTTTTEPQAITLSLISDFQSAP